MPNFSLSYSTYRNFTKRLLLQCPFSFYWTVIFIPGILLQHLCQYLNAILRNVNVPCLFQVPEYWFDLSSSKQRGGVIASPPNHRPRPPNHRPHPPQPQPSSPHPQPSSPSTKALIPPTHSPHPPQPQPSTPHPHPSPSLSVSHHISLLHGGRGQPSPWSHPSPPPFKHCRSA